jgi:hypothetical protein
MEELCGSEKEYKNGDERENNDEQDGIVVFYRQPNCKIPRYMGSTPDSHTNSPPNGSSAQNSMA